MNENILTELKDNKMYYAVKQTDHSYLDKNGLGTFDFNNAYITDDQSIAEAFAIKMNHEYKEELCFCVDVTEIMAMI